MTSSDSLRRVPTAPLLVRVLLRPPSSTFRLDFSMAGEWPGTLWAPSESSTQTSYNFRDNAFAYSTMSSPPVASKSDESPGFWPPTALRHFSPGAPILDDTYN
ncbi:hypothetical protein EMPG_11042 [Blastomyces silverae]|uniref:Uncharacterized protein n=1 Tax=Blastomyces silverae TaxID=2060906 RepID=A0A0H1B311_9EURO|nr:hypothetical protein EMPG_11042 [Blastomyces silverae]